MKFAVTSINIIDYLDKPFDIYIFPLLVFKLHFAI